MMPRISSVFLLAALAGPTAQGADTFISIDIPGATATRAVGIADGAVVGDFIDSAGKQHGDIVGTRYDDNSGAPSAIHGFLLQHGRFTALDYPGKLGLIPQRINDAGQIVGCNHDNDLMESMHGFLYSDGAWSQLDAGRSMTNGLLPDGSLAVGLYNDMMNKFDRAFALGGSNMAPFDFPFAIRTRGWDINPSGEVVGEYTDAANAFHGYLLILPPFDLTFGITQVAGEPVSYRFISIDYPGAKTTQAYGINASGHIVGAYVDTAGKQHGFLLVRGRQRGH